ncbi:MAG: ATP synthase F1 subunit gamma [Bacteroidetes bacterium]|nr:ATP synthase F1 subunit gamma [Bacteroidota bacterium]
MANLKEIRVRIASVKSTRQITSAMKMVSASKLRKAQNGILNLRPYAQKLQHLLAILQHRTTSANQGENINPFSQNREVKNILLIVFTANKGLCGPFNSFVIKSAIRRIEEIDKTANVKLFLVGKKGFEFFKKRDTEILGHELDVLSSDNYKYCITMAERFMNMFISGDVDQIEMVYNKFKNPAVQEVVCEQFLPFSNNSVDSKGKKLREEEVNDIILEPNEIEVLNELIPKTIRTMFYRVALDSFASEQGARMTAMHKATDNATEVLKDLTIKYNKVRQATITGEIVEIVSGAEALNQ